MDVDALLQFNAQVAMAESETTQNHQANEWWEDGASRLFITALLTQAGHSVLLCCAGRFPRADIGKMLKTHRHYIIEKACHGLGLCGVTALEEADLTTNDMQALQLADHDYATFVQPLLDAGFAGWRTSLPAPLAATLVSKGGIASCIGFSHNQNKRRAASHLGLARATYFSSDPESWSVLLRQATIDLRSLPQFRAAPPRVAQLAIEDAKHRHVPRTPPQLLQAVPAHVPGTPPLQQAVPVRPPPPPQPVVPAQQAVPAASFIPVVPAPPRRVPEPVPEPAVPVPQQAVPEPAVPAPSTPLGARGRAQLLAFRAQVAAAAAKKAAKKAAQAPSASSAAQPSQAQQAQAPKAKAPRSALAIGQAPPAPAPLALPPPGRHISQAPKAKAPPAPQRLPAPEDVDEDVDDDHTWQVKHSVSVKRFKEGTGRQ